MRWEDGIDFYRVYPIDNGALQEHMATEYQTKEEALGQGWDKIQVWGHDAMLVVEVHDAYTDLPWEHEVGEYSSPPE